MRSSNAFSLWFPQQSQSAVPIELIDIAPKSKSTAKTISPKPLSLTQKSVPARSPQTARTTPRNQDFGAINSADNLQQKKQTYASQPNSQPFRQQGVATATPKSTPTPTVPVSNLPWNRRQEIKLGKGTLLPTGVPSNSPGSEAENRETPPTSAQKTPVTPTRETPRTPPSQETPATPTRETPRAPTQETPVTPARETPRATTQETPATPAKATPRTPTQGASVAIVAPLLKDEVSSLIQSGRLRQDALPDVIALYRGSNTKELDSSFLVQNSGLEPAQLLASLIIDNNGNFQQAVVLEIEPATLQSEKSTYQQVLSEVFKTENFIAAHNNDGTKPELSNLYVRINIQPANSN
ncbi:D-alanyl-D-alanine carboxypeptidase [Nostoc flagelliforme CCNUN1]|uniref:D-alanyl-D-alanine carboxypeptidase n=2 Tax=Nostoc flagelliforme TaxID=1306274 RepID=A0A2K8SNG5_9NOSO|nr:D-alanyl-D-alanine carboxypeptidase [Nostoc flagelliforme CCNUN1]